MTPMQVRRIPDGEIFHLDTSREKSGGEGSVFPVQGRDLVVKVYHDSSQMNSRKLKAMLANAPQDPMERHGWTSIAWPTCLVQRRGTACGFAMPLVEDADSLYSFLNPDTRRQQHPRFNYRYLHRLGYNLATAVEAVHEEGHVISDINTQNALANDRGVVALIDCDSWQIKDPQRSRPHVCPVGRPEFTPPENQGKKFSRVICDKTHDQFGLAVLLFMLLMEGHHPYAGRFLNSGRPPGLGKRIARGKWPYASGTRAYEPRPSSPPYEVLPLPLQKLFRKCFQRGHRDPNARPSAREWKKALEDGEGNMTTCSRQPHHRYSSHLSTCPWCKRATKLNRDPFPKSTNPNSSNPAQQKTSKPSRGKPGRLNRRKWKKRHQPHRQPSPQPGAYTKTPSRPTPTGLTSPSLPKVSTPTTPSPSSLSSPVAGHGPTDLTASSPSLTSPTHFQHN